MLDPAHHRTYAPRPHTLTAQRWAILQYIDEYMQEHGWAPSDAEVQQAVGIKSHSWTRYQLYVLSELGKIEYGGSRKIRRMPETVAE